MNLTLFMIHSMYSSGSCTEEEYNQLIENYERRQKYKRKLREQVHTESYWKVPSWLKPDDPMWGPYFGDFAEN